MYGSNCPFGVFETLNGHKTGFIGYFVSKPTEKPKTVKFSVAVGRMGKAKKQTD